ncbi:MAG: hypothetical protein HZB46_02070 [Solirubrobacterales bacterium]|nr:hypothetical protein [Solirubrobacterales bacterium]
MRRTATSSALGSIALGQVGAVAAGGDRPRAAAVVEVLGQERDVGVEGQREVADERPQERVSHHLRGRGGEQVEQLVLPAARRRRVEQALKGSGRAGWGRTPVRRGHAR